MLYQRLWKVDKAKKIAPFGCMRKLLTMLNARHNHPSNALVEHL